jgi:nitroimidazol reductase NimA-like FMN-containing flavoprotein (pyridoxamine 5'-phosphate oxidase superfamily)
MERTYIVTAILLAVTGCAMIFLTSLPAAGADDNPAPESDVYRLPAMTADDVQRLLASQKLCRMALNDAPAPYIIAMDYVYMDGGLYFHFADYGRKMELIEMDPNVSVMIDNFCGAAGDFDTVMLAGRLERVTGGDERARVAQALADSAGQRGGAGNLAARHGLETLDAGALSSPSQQIYRLVAVDKVALRSPG